MVDELTSICGIIGYVLETRNISMHWRTTALGLVSSIFTKAPRGATN